MTEKFQSHEVMSCPRCNSGGGIIAHRGQGESVVLECNHCSWSVTTTMPTIEKILERHRNSFGADKET